MSRDLRVQLFVVLHCQKCAAKLGQEQTQNADGDLGLICSCGAGSSEGSIIVERPGSTQNGSVGGRMSRPAGRTCAARRTQTFFEDTRLCTSSTVSTRSE